MPRLSKEFLAESKVFWQKQYDRVEVKLTDGDVEQICNNMLNLVETLGKLRHAEAKKDSEV